MISINFSISFLKNFFKTLFIIIKKRKKDEIKNFDNNQDVIESTSESSENLIQEDLPFNKKPSENQIKYKFKLPSIDFLKKPTKSERDKNLSEDKIDEKTLEKILLDFGVEGNIKKVSRGPVVTLNEFEPAAGIKVSKIINLSEDIARNTSSESARIATIPGSNTIGIELPNSSRENVYLSEIISNTNFLKKKLNFL